MVIKSLSKAAFIAGLALCVTTMAQAAEKKDEPKLITGADATMLSNTCAGCHGTDGASTGPATPTIAGISSAYFIELMEGFQSGDVPSTIMKRIADGYSAEEIEAMAGFFSEKKFVPAAGQEVDDKLASKGEKLHDKYCEKCHAEGGSSAEDDSGILAGQWKPYLMYTLTDFTAGDREMTKKMKKKVEQLMEKEGDAGLEALLNFYASKK